MKLKKLSLVLAAVIGLGTGLTGCSSSKTEVETTTAAATESTAAENAATESESAADTEATAETTAAGGILKVGVKGDVLGFGYKDPLSGEYDGMEISIAKLISEKLGYDDIEFTTVTAATRTELLDSGDLDCVLATFTITDERKKSWDFSTPYYTDAVTVLVEDADGITSLDGLVGKKIGVSTGSTSAYALVKAMTEKGLFADYTLPETSNEFDISSFSVDATSFTQFGDYPSISNAMTAGTIDAFCVDKSILSNYKLEGRSYIEESFSPQDYGVATKKGSPLSAKIDELINTWLEDGTIDSLISEYNLN